MPSKEIDTQAFNEASGAMDQAWRKIVKTRQLDTYLDRKAIDDKTFDAWRRGKFPETPPPGREHIIEYIRALNIIYPLTRDGP